MTVTKLPGPEESANGIGKDACIGNDAGIFNDAAHALLRIVADAVT